MIPAPTAPARLEDRQLLGPLDRPSNSSTSCPPITLSSGGILTFGPQSTVTLDAPIVYNDNTCTVADPFYASTWVFVYVLAICTIIAWIFLVLLVVTQRTLHPASASTSSRWIPGSGITTAIAGRTPLGGLGSKPWLQKLAVFLVACGLTVASVDTFRVAGFHNGREIINATDMRDEVSGSLEVRILRVLSGVFVWLAQVQTLMRLFPRRKEKLIIKWFGFSLILCDLVFNCLNNFLPNYQYSSSPSDYRDAIPALSYLFQLSISLLYLAWVSYYVVTKKRYAFFIPDQLNMLVIAGLALVSIAIPVAFFVADISVPKVAGWGDLLRWVGSAAASIIVWEWVDRIEAVEREEKKDGILGREVFDEDELPTSEERSSQGGSHRGSDSEQGRGHLRGPISGLSPQSMLNGIVRRLGRKQRKTEQEGHDSRRSSARRKRQTNGETRTKTIEEEKSKIEHGNSTGNQGRPLSPPNREDTGSAESTLYAIHYHATPPVASNQAGTAHEGTTGSESRVFHDREITFASEPAQLATSTHPAPSKQALSKILPTSLPGWSMATNAFKRRKHSPPIEVKQALSLNPTNGPTTNGTAHSKTVHHRFLSGLRDGHGDKAVLSDASQAEGISSHPTIIPAPPRGHTWSPGIHRHSPVDALDMAGPASRLHVNPAVQQRNVAPQDGSSVNEAQRTSARPPQQVEARREPDDVAESPNGHRALPNIELSDDIVKPVSGSQAEDGRSNHG